MKHTFNTARLLSFVMVLAVLLTAGIVLGINASAAGTVAEVGTEADLIAALAAGGDIQLTADIELTATATINVSANATLSSKQDESKEGPEIYTITRSKTTGFSMFTVAASVTFTLENVTLEGGNYEETSDVRGGAIRNDGTFVILGEGATIQNFRANRGAAVYGKVALLGGSVIRGNYATYGGSAIATNTVWIMPGALIENNESGAGAYGGVIFLDSGGKLVMRGGTIQNNTSKRLSSVIDTNGNFTIYLAGGTIINNSTSGSAGAPAILLRPTSSKNTGRVYIGTNNTNSQPTAVNGIAPESSLQMYNNGESNFGYYGNQAKECLTVDRVVFDANLSAASRVDYTEVTFDVPETSAGAGDGYTAKHFSLSTAIADAMLRGVTEVALTRFDDGVATLPAGTYTVNGLGNTFKRVVSGKSMFTLLEGANATFTNITLDGNQIKADGEDGGAFNVPAGATLTLTGKDTQKVTIQGFEAGLGGAIYSKGTLAITDALFSGNVSITNKTNVGGGAIYFGGGTSTIGGETEFAGNKAVQGGALSFYGTAGDRVNVTIGEDVSIHDNATSGIGGALILFSHSTVTLTGNASIYDNTASGTYGGAIYTSGGTVVIQENVSIRNNKLLKTNYAAGQAIAMQHATLIMTGGTIENNGQNGADSPNNWQHAGAVFTNVGCEIWILDGTISGNKASNSGGAFQLSKATDRLYMLGGTVSGNTVGGSKANKVGNGGAMNIGEATAYLMGGTITGNGQDGTNAGTTTYAGAIVMSEAGSLYLMNTVTVDEIPDAVVAFANGAGSDVFSIDGDGKTITAKTPLIIADNGLLGDKDAEQISTTGNLYVGNLVEGSRIVLEDDVDGKLATLVGEVGDATVDMLHLRGADALYRAEKNEAGTELAWPTHEYLIVGRAAQLNEAVTLRLYIAKRNSNNETAPEIKIADRVVAWSSENVVDADFVATVPSAAYYLGAYYVEIDMAPKEMTEDVIVAYGESDVQTRTLAAYLEQLQAVDASVAPLAKALLAYGSAAQVHFGYNTEALANPNYASDIQDIGVEANNLSITGANPTAFHSAEVDVGSKVSVAVIVKAEFAKKKADVQVQLGENGKDFEIRDINGTTDYVAIAIYDISAADLMKPITVTVKDGVDLDTTSVLTYSIPAYAYRMQNATETEQITSKLKVLVKALYAYATAAARYAK